MTGTEAAGGTGWLKLFLPLISEVVVRARRVDFVENAVKKRVRLF